MYSWKEPFGESVFHEAFSGEVIDPLGRSGSNHGRIEIALMIAGDYCRAAGKILPPEYSEPEKEPEHNLKQQPESIIDHLLKPR